VARCLKKVLQINHGNQFRAAKTLGAQRNTSGREMAQFGLDCKSGNRPARAGEAEVRATAKNNNPKASGL